MAQQNVLPDPNHGRAADGEESSSSANLGPGFKSVKLTSRQKVMRSTTNSGRLLQRFHGYHKWEVNITYNSLTKDEFKEVYAFLLERRTTLAPFFVQLPQYRGQSSTSTIVDQGPIAAGSTTITLEPGDGANCAVGDLFTITDSNNSNHLKAYKITKVSTDTITITPPLSKAVTDGSTIVLVDPLIKVVQKGEVQEYSLNNNNLYKFSLNLEEVQ